MPSDLTTAAQKLRRSKDRWGSYAIDHDAIDALADLLDTVAYLEHLIDNREPGGAAFSSTETAIVTAATQLAALIGGDHA